MHALGILVIYCTAKSNENSIRLFIEITRDFPFPRDEEIGSPIQPSVHGIIVSGYNRFPHSNLN